MYLLSRRSAISVVLLLTISAAVASAQTQPLIRTGSFYTVKADRVSDFLAAAKDYASVMKKLSSDRHFTVWQAVSGPREYVLVRYHAKWAELDTPNEAKLKDAQSEITAITNRIMATVESSHRQINLLEHELSIPLVPGRPIKPLASVLRQWVRPEHSTAYRELVKNELLPAAKRAELPLFSVTQNRFGGSRYEYSIVTAMDGWANLDGEPPIVKAMGGRANYDKFLGRMRPLIVRSEYQMYRHLPDLSYVGNTQ